VLSHVFQLYPYPYSLPYMLAFENDSLGR
jgi:hypothetical protein